MSKPSKIGSAMETTIIFSSKGVIEDLAKEKRNTKKRTQSMNGTLGEKIKDAVENKHLDRKAFSMACQLDAMPDETLHVTFHSLIKYCEDLGVTKRASAQEELFDSRRGSDEAEATQAKPKTTAKAKGKDKDSENNVTQIGTAARKVVESAGAEKTH